MDPIRDGNLAPMQNSSVVSLLRERAGLQPDDLAFRYTDYEQDWAGVTETLSWATATGTSRRKLSAPSAQYWPTPRRAHPRDHGCEPGTSDSSPEGEIFIVGRMKDLLIVHGRNHYPEDIESTVQEITGGRVAAISVPVDQSEKLVTIIEVKKRADTDEEAREKLLVPPGSIPTTTSGKIRRSACVEQYRQRQFTRLDA